MSVLPAEVSSTLIRGIAHVLHDMLEVMKQNMLIVAEPDAVIAELRARTSWNKFGFYSVRMRNALVLQHLRCLLSRDSSPD